jgi:subfamily B ATP-binding cassette protein HlyB/CyaB
MDSASSGSPVDPAPFLSTTIAGWHGKEPAFGWGWFAAQLPRHGGVLADILLAAFVAQLAGLFTPIGFQVIIDKVLAHRAEATLTVVIAGLLLLAGGEFLLGALRVQLQNHVAWRVDLTLGNALYDRLLRLPAGWFGQRRVGDVVAQVREMENVRHFLGGTAPALCIDLLFAFTFLAVLAAYSALLCVPVVAAILVYALLAAAVTPALQARVRARIESGAAVHSTLVETVAGIMALRTAAAAYAEQQRWRELLGEHAANGARATGLNGVTAQAAALINRLAGVAVLWLGAFQVMDGALSVGQFVAFNLIAARLGAPILRITQCWIEFQQLRLSVARLAELMNTTGESRAAPHAQRPRAPAGRLTLHDVAFRYHPELPDALRELNLDFAAGSLTGIVGRSGSGKSTLARLLQGLYAPQRGRILLDGADLATLDPDWLRRTVGVVAQEPYLFRRSVRDNIALGLPGMAPQRIEHAARLAAAHDFIMELPRGYDTVLDERGAGLSGGQRQRLAIARALAADPRVLILDEATSALDFESEQALRANLPYLCKGRTVLIISHRPAFLRAVQRIVVLDSGRVAECGAPQALLAAGGWFARFCGQWSAPAARR